MDNFLQKAKTLVKRRRNAKKIGIAFTRAAAWKMPKKIIINERDIYLHAELNASTDTSFIDIFLDDVYGLRFFKSILPRVHSIADVGANQGFFSLAAKNIFDAVIHAYEPNSAIIQYTTNHLSFDDVTIYNEAVGLLNGYVEIEQGKDSLHSKTKLSGTGEIRQVAFETVVSRMNDSIDLLKLDCEGAEWDILQDTKSLKKVKAITLEYHLDDVHNHDSIKRVLQAANFKILHHEIAGETWGMVWALNNRVG